jgi:hypothetical protein
MSKTLEQLLHDYLTPLNMFILLVTWTLPVMCMILYKRSVKRSKHNAEPLTLFLTEFTSGASPGHDKKFFQMFHPNVLKKIEKGTLRAMCRCIVTHYGQFISIIPGSLSLKVVGFTTSVTARATFEKADNIAVHASWITEYRQPWQITAFNVIPRGSDEFDVLSFIKPEDFVPYGEKFVCSLFAKSPSVAVSMMYPTLKDKYAKEDLLAGEMLKILRACGGLRNRSEVDLTVVDGRIVRSGDKEGSKTSGVELEFAVLGAVRDIKVSIKIVFTNLECSVIRYGVVAQPPAQKNVVYDQDAQSIIAEH